MREYRQAMDDCTLSYRRDGDGSLSRRLGTAVDAAKWTLHRIRSGNCHDKAVLIVSPLDTQVDLAHKSVSTVLDGCSCTQPSLNLTFAPHSIGRTSKRARLPDTQYRYTLAWVQIIAFAYIVVRSRERVERGSWYRECACCARQQCHRLQAKVLRINVHESHRAAGNTSGA